MNTFHTVKALASSLAANTAMAVVLGMSLSPAAYAGDIEEGYPLFINVPAKQAPVQTPAAETAPSAAPANTEERQRNSPDRVSTEESNAMLGEDSGSFWMTQQQARNPASAVAHVDSIKR